MGQIRAFGQCCLFGLLMQMRVVVEGGGVGGCEGRVRLAGGCGVR